MAAQGNETYTKPHQMVSGPEDQFTKLQGIIQNFLTRSRHFRVVLWDCDSKRCIDGKRWLWETAGYQVAVPLYCICSNALRELKDT